MCIHVCVLVSLCLCAGAHGGSLTQPQSCDLKPDGVHVGAGAAESGQQRSVGHQGASDAGDAQFGGVAWACGVAAIEVVLEVAGEQAWNRIVELVAIKLRRGFGSPVDGLACNWRR